MPTEREELIRDIDGLKESICLAWMDMLSKPMTGAEREDGRFPLLVGPTMPRPSTALLTTF